MLIAGVEVKGGDEIRITGIDSEGLRRVGLLGFAVTVAPASPHEGPAAIKLDPFGTEKVWFPEGQIESIEVIAR